MSEDLIIEHCSPTLAGIKTGNLFSVKVTNEEELNRDIRELNDRLRAKGLRVIPLKVTRKYALIYIYRPSRLMKDLNDPQASLLLKSMGYKLKNPECCIVELVQRLKCEESFPHEIGLFLGYPPEDVRGFIENRAKGSRLTGYWKVYGDVNAAKKRFEAFRKCTDYFCRQFERGCTVLQLAAEI